MPLGGKGVRPTSDPELLRPVLSAGGGPLVGVAEGCFVPVLTAGGGPTGVAEGSCVMPVLTTGGEPLPVV